jgi:hypothetical protein
MVPTVSSACARRSRESEHRGAANRRLEHDARRLTRSARRPNYAVPAQTGTHPRVGFRICLYRSPDRRRSQKRREAVERWIPACAGKASTGLDRARLKVAAERGFVSADHALEPGNQKPRCFAPHSKSVFPAKEPVREFTFTNFPGESRGPPRRELDRRAAGTASPPPGNPEWWTGGSRLSPGRQRRRFVGCSISSQAPSARIAGKRLAQAPQTSQVDPAASGFGGSGR